ncbi:MAG TPA: VOC family protein [Thermomicrobiaceae bacterium]|nr:VOC family protein [Thermomicrobiaceae bacterium]
MAGTPMRPVVSVITLGVEDLERAMVFYRDGLGWPTAGIVGTEFAGDETHPSGAAVMFELEGGLLLMLYPRAELAKDAGEALGRASSNEFSLGYLTRHRDQVDAIIARARSAGARVTDEPHERPWGIYSGYFKDPDGHLWEIIWNPGVPE